VFDGLFRARAARNALDGIDAAHAAPETRGKKCGFTFGYQKQSLVAVNIFSTSEEKPLTFDILDNENNLR